jgi:hypothetical protein
MIEHREISREDIACRAYALYVERGRELGGDVEDWVRAERELRAEVVVTPRSAMAAQAGQAN